MRQVALLPAGAQPWNRHTITAHSNTFAYASTLSVYVFRQHPEDRTYQLASILAGHEKTITAVHLSPLVDSLVLSASQENKVVVRNLVSGAEVTRLRTAATPHAAVFSPVAPRLIAIGDARGELTIWNFESGVEERAPGVASSPITVIAFNPSIAAIVAVGTGKGKVIVAELNDGIVAGALDTLTPDSSSSAVGPPHAHDAAAAGPSSASPPPSPPSSAKSKKAKSKSKSKTKSKSKSKSKSRSLQSRASKPARATVVELDTITLSPPASLPSSTPVADLAWDPLSNNYLLVLYLNSALCMFDVEGQTLLREFKSPSNGVRSVGWLMQSPGEFVTTDAKSGSMRVWNVSKEEPKETIRVAAAPFSNLKFLNKSMDAVCSFKDGSVGVYSLARRVWASVAAPGHRETIFDAKFCPSNANHLATASFDGTLKVWDIRSMACIASSPGNEGVLYCLSWSPTEPRILASSAEGHVVVFDAERSTIVGRNTHHTDAVFRVAWNARDPEVYASASRDGTVAVCSVDGKLLRKFKHPKACYGVSWSPFVSGLLATGCHDGHVRTFAMDMGRVLADAASDAAPRVSADAKSVTVFKGHTGRTFNVAFSPLLADWLASGSDDEDVRVWSLLSGSTVAVLSGHTSNVRGLAWSPEIPYILLSGAWDSSIRVWDIRSSSCLTVVSDHHADVYGLTVHPSRPFVFASSSRDTTLRLWEMDSTVRPLRLALIAGTTNLADVIAAPLDAVAAPPDAPLRLCGTASATLASLTSPPAARALLGLFFAPRGLDEIFDLADGISPTSGVGLPLPGATASPRDDEPRGVIGGPTRAERLRTALDAALTDGRMREYCELAYELGDHATAVAAAPTVSLEYWSELAGRYAAELDAAGSADAGVYMMCAGGRSAFVEWLISRGELTRAYHAALAEGGSGAEPSSLAARVAELAARSAYLLSQPLVAAACHVAVGNGSRAVHTLMQGWEVEIAYVVAAHLHLPHTSHISAALASIADRLGCRDVARALTKGLPQARARLALSSLGSSSSSAAAAALADAERALAAGAPAAQVVVLFAASSDPARALDVGLDALAHAVGDGRAWDACALGDIVDGMCSVKEKVLRAYGRRVEVMAWASFVGAWKAMWRGYVPIVGVIVENVRAVAGAHAHAFGIPILPLLVAAARFLAVHGFPAKASALAAAAKTGAGPRSPELEASISLLKRQMAICQTQPGGMVDADPRATANVMIVTGARLPSGLTTRDPKWSLFSGKQIDGPVFRIRGSNAKYLSREEALMWGKVCPLSPLNDGRRIWPWT